MFTWTMLNWGELTDAYLLIILLIKPVVCKTKQISIFAKKTGPYFLLIFN